MSTDRPPSTTGPAAGSAAPDPETTRTPHATPPQTKSRTPSGSADALRASRTSGIWVAMVALVVVIILLAVFILQNTQQTAVSFLGWTGTAPLSATLLIAAGGGALLVSAAGALRILQLRRRVKRERKAS